MYYFICHMPVYRCSSLHLRQGFNNLPRQTVAKNVGAPLSINALADIVRLECGMAGWSEVLPLILCSHDENFAWLNRKDDGKTAVRLANPKTAEYQIVRTSLLPGLLKTLRENKSHSKPMKVFETSDVVFKNDSLERKARNERHFSAAWYGTTSGFEEVHGLLDRVMLMLRQAFLTRQEGIKEGKSLDFQVTESHTKQDGYWLEPLVDDTFVSSFQSYLSPFCQFCEQMLSSERRKPPKHVLKLQAPYSLVCSKEIPTDTIL
jgi:phenylalanyl-tRNA synthetase beta chain